MPCAACLRGPSIGLGLTEDQVKESVQLFLTNSIDANGKYRWQSVLDFLRTFADKSNREYAAQLLIAAGVDNNMFAVSVGAYTVGDALKKANTELSVGGLHVSRTAASVWGVLATASFAACVYHGYKRNDSVGWAIGWGVLATVFPVITPVIAIAQGYGKPHK